MRGGRHRVQGRGAGRRLAQLELAQEQQQLSQLQVNKNFRSE
jgi:hypothetical protein